MIQEISFKDFLIYSSGVHFVYQSGTNCAILVEGIMRNISEIILNLDQLFRCHFKILLFLDLMAILFDREEPFVKF